MIVEQTLLSKGRKKKSSKFISSRQTIHVKMKLFTSAFQKVYLKLRISWSSKVKNHENTLIRQKIRIFKIIKMPELDSPNLKFWTETSKGFPTELL